MNPTPTQEEPVSKEEERKFYDITRRTTLDDFHCSHCGLEKPFWGGNPCKSTGGHTILFSLKDQPSEGWEPKWGEGWLNHIRPYVEKWKAQGRTEEQIFGVENFLTGAGGVGITSLLATARREESELWMNAVCSVVDAETLDKIREVIWKQERSLFTKKD